MPPLPPAPASADSEPPLSRESTSPELHHLLSGPAPSPAPPPQTIRVIVVDDHPAVRDAVGRAVAGRPDLALAGAAGSAADAFALARAHGPDVAVVDLALADAHGLDLVRALRAERPALAVVVFSMYDEAVYAERALRAGAMGYVRKTAPTEAVVDAVRSAAAGDVYLARSAASRILARVAAGGGAGAVGGAVGGDGAASGSGLDALTDREMAVFELLGQGRDPSAIAGHLSLSRKTVETYRRRAREKLGLGSVTELLQFAIRWTCAQESGGADQWLPE